MRERAAAVGGELRTGAGDGRRLPGRGHPAREGGGGMTSPAPAIRVVVADDHQVVRTGFAALLDTQPDFTVARHRLRRGRGRGVCRELQPDVVLMDVRMPRHGRHRGHQAAGRLGCGQPSSARRQQPGPGRRVPAGQAARAHPDHLRPGRVRLRRAARRRQRLPAQGRHRRAALRRGAGRRRRRRAARPDRHPPPDRRVRPAAPQADAARRPRSPRSPRARPRCSGWSPRACPTRR